jgi:hypothetical protein
MYNALITDTRVMRNTLLWKLKIPLRIKIFMWYLKRGVMLTKDILARQNWDGCAYFAHIQKQFNTYSLIVTLVGLYGEQCK